MNVGTKSLLFGVHQIFWHPICVSRAWRFIHGRWPTRAEWICIIVHDWGYWGCPNMDGEIGKTHPEAGARIARRLIYLYSRWRGHNVENANVIAEAFYQFTLFHSRFYAARQERSVSPLFLPDKLAVLFEPRWFYLLRGWLSGEVAEYIANAPGDFRTAWDWLNWYQRKVYSMLKRHE